MQDRYVPDLGDYSKLALVEGLARPAAPGGLRVGLVWYRVDLGETNGDGRHVGYLDLGGKARERFRAGAPELYDALVRLRRSGARSVEAYRRRDVLRAGRRVVWFEEVLDLARVGEAGARAAARAAWARRALEAVEGADLVVLDPDNGLEVPSTSPTSLRGVKFATLAECAAFAGAGARSLVVYQHAHRRGPVRDQARRALGRLAAALGRSPREGFALRWHRGTSRLYLVVPAPRHAALLRARTDELLSGALGREGHLSRAS